MQETTNISFSLYMEKVFLVFFVHISLSFSTFGTLLLKYR